MTHDGLDESLINRLREKYANMSKSSKDAASNVSKGPIAAKESAVVHDSAQANGTEHVAASGSTARICGVCSGSGERCYEYNFRQMTEQCKHCDGNGLLNCQNAAESSSKAAKRGTFVPGSQRIMTEQQQARVKALKFQIAKLDHKIRALEEERCGLTEKVIPGPDQEALKDDLIEALDQTLASLRTAQQNRQDRLSYYDGMVEPDAHTQSSMDESFDHCSMESRSTSSSTGTTVMDSS